ncbi:uncharacterized protein Z520_02735 [Fonsecaea multimorphosa CBS 102226]|uniref:Oxidoreductase-like domain-containing protein n=1 Tax=Fonsecaea multimorphosa CBS 102226 TaxID=1442371 RepID=A0A0D2K5U2_9EURO|nr:uncharacterized protein Z520_02735 [Fonsecaea multimorphosa CBS 102226]KIY01183.1 hypothetical protein Z520_02735 [Fonsecaea multimorphosa CBS 102226]OAL28795.1 hypothetical protein AYO22_02660 [Fonsecaea multimorphosa]
MALQNPILNMLPRIRWTCASCLQQQLKVQQRQISTSSLRSAFRPTSSRALVQRHPTQGLRTFTTTAQMRDEQQQAVPLGDFYTELLSTPIQKHPATYSDLPTFVQPGDESKMERARKVFGSIRGSGYERRTSSTPDSTWRTINGVAVPPKPAEPDNCCMSGCVHCVWDDYRDDVEEWAARVHEAQSKAPRRGRRGAPKIEMARPEVSEASGSMDDDGGGSESLWTTPSAEANEEDILFQGIPVGIREFMATEKRIRDRRRARKEKGQQLEDDDFV